MLNTTPVRGGLAFLLLAAHVIAMALSAKVIDDVLESDAKALAFFTVQANSYTAVFNIIGFLFACGFCVFELLSLNSAEKDGSASFSLASLLLTSGLIELGFAAKSVDHDKPSSLDDIFIATRAFGLIAGGLSLLVFVARVGARGGSSA